MNFTNLNFLGITKNYEFLTQTFTKTKNRNTFNGYTQKQSQNRQKHNKSKC